MIPLSKNEDPHKRLINNKSSSKNIELKDTNSNMNLSQKSTESKSWKIDKTLLNDSEFRKSHIKKKEKLEISCEANSEHVLSAFIFDLTAENEKTDEFGLNFNNLVRSNFKTEFSQITEFLESINLEKYLTLFVEKNIDTFQRIISIIGINIKELNDAKLEEMKIPLGHRLKILKRLEEVKNIQAEENEDEKMTDKEVFQEKELASTNHNPNNKITKRKVEIASKHSIGVGVIIEETNNAEDEEQNDYESLKLQNLGDKEFNMIGLFCGDEHEEQKEHETIQPYHEISRINETKNNFNLDKYNSILVKKECISCWECLALNDKEKMCKLNEKVGKFLLI